jgi:LmbE family N-acetylglucosaminyl deacetylase
MSSPRRLMAVLAHPDDESLGFGGTLAKYAAAGIDVFLVTATRGEGGRFRGLRPGQAGHPGTTGLGRIREAELRAAAKTLGLRDVSLLGYRDGHLDDASPSEAIARLAADLRRVRPDVVVTFGPDGAYGHPDHIAICQFTTAAVMAAANATFATGPIGAAADAPHAAAKLYYLAWPESAYRAYEAAVQHLASTVDGIERHATPWPEWAITTVIETADVWPTVWRAVSCHESQLAAYERLRDLPPEHHKTLWSRQSFYRAFSLVNGGRATEADLFEGFAPSDERAARHSSPAADPPVA